MKMKSIYGALAAFALLLTACKKQESVTTLDAGTAPTLTASVANNGQIPLDYYVRGNNAITFNWTNPDYKLSSGPNSQAVTYRIEIDTVGANFTNPKKRTVTVAGDLSKSFTQEQFNDMLYTGLQLKDSIQHNIEVRVTSYMGNNAAQLKSNTMTFKVKPYDIPPKVAPPTTGRLWITGSATPASWMGGGDAPRANQEFTRISNTKYEITLPLNGGQSYLFVPQYGDWGDKYGYTGAGNANNPSADEFKRGGNDLKAPASSGNYKIVVDFKLGTYTVTPV
ncbi:SusE domain-containing protein [Flaviaesturariibacter terrae]